MYSNSKNVVIKVFWENPYLYSLQTRIKSVENENVTLFETIAFSFSGGQESDDGKIGSYNILKSKIIDKDIIYTLPYYHTLEVGDQVTVTIDWEKRYKIMKLHFAAELILELINQNFNKPKKIGANISGKKARLDFVWADNISNIFPSIIKQILKIISDNLNIESNYSDREKEVRYWQIKGFGKVPCSGTHIKSTGEIGQIKLLRVNTGKNKERIEIYLMEQYLNQKKMRR